jgi:hypothetical protein
MNTTNTTECSEQFKHLQLQWPILLLLLPICYCIIIIATLVVSIRHVRAVRIASKEIDNQSVSSLLQ